MEKGADERLYLKSDFCFLPDNQGGLYQMLEL